jgi:tRNA(Arg) A34 adenosine deaminase TadA
MQGSTVPDGAIRRAIQAATETEGIKRYKLGAVLFDKRGNILNVKGNCRKTHPALSKFTPFPYLHAESYCLISHGLDHCRGLNLFVTRLDSTGRPTMAKPCSVCSSLGRFVGLRSLIYTDWEGKIVEDSSRH